MRNRAIPTRRLLVSLTLPWPLSCILSAISSTSSAFSLSALIPSSVSSLLVYSSPLFCLPSLLLSFSCLLPSCCISLSSSFSPSLLLSPICLLTQPPYRSASDLSSSPISVLSTNYLLSLPLCSLSLSPLVPLHCSLLLSASPSSAFAPLSALSLLSASSPLSAASVPLYSSFPSSSLSSPLLLPPLQLLSSSCALYIVSSLTLCLAQLSDSLSPLSAVYWPPSTPSSTPLYEPSALSVLLCVIIMVLLLRAWYLALSTLSPLLCSAASLPFSLFCSLRLAGSRGTTNHCSLLRIPTGSPASISLIFEPLWFCVLFLLCSLPPLASLDFSVPHSTPHSCSHQTSVCFSSSSCSLPSSLVLLLRSLSASYLRRDKQLRSHRLSPRLLLFS
ncbi:hypothetical protein C7M84_021293 [Penaeus vannamei]|uniref:Uncharacterized protein n=1 Tax=Penaeus vannamei TaxID=6689 RepID=A0A3R7LRI4_PENVA|nr:hypothetical protein C7M84_021293 [Penaeus vannamei]